MPETMKSDNAMRSLDTDGLATSSLTNPKRTQIPRALQRRTPSLAKYATTPITKHYQLNHQILAAFESHFEAKLYRVAYAMGMQFVETALLEIPKHGYFYSHRHERERMESSIEAVRVASILRDIQAQDADEFSTDLERVQRLHELALHQVEQASEDQYESQRAKTERDLRHNLAEWVVLDPLLLCHDSFSSIFCLTPATASPVTVPHMERLPSAPSQKRKPVDPPSASEELREIPSAKTATSRDESTREGGTTFNSTVSSALPPRPPVSSTLPPKPESVRPPRPGLKERDDLLAGLPWQQGVLPLVKSSTVPSKRTHFQQLPVEPLIDFQASWSQPPPLVAQQNDFGPPHAQSVPVPEDDWMLVCQASNDAVEDMELERALFLSGLEVVNDPESFSTVEQGSEHPPPPLCESTSSRLDFSTLSTFYREDFDHLVETKRIRVSTASTYQGRIPSSTNGCAVIAPLLCMHHLLNDEVTPDPSLPDAGIVHVIDQETPAILGELRSNLGLSDQAFLIPSDVHDYLIENGQLHQSQFVSVVGGNILQEEHLHSFVEAMSDPQHPKLASTLFFHEHVIAILKVDRGHGKVWYDCVDSLPLPEMLRLENETDENFWRRFGLASDDPVLLQVLFPFTVRFRCTDPEALQAWIRWYACSKFSDENIRYIDQYDWEEAQTDFDARVFQAFLWGRPKA
jgi:hypothetical protein